MDVREQLGVTGNLADIAVLGVILCMYGLICSAITFGASND